MAGRKKLDKDVLDEILQVYRKKHSQLFGKSPSRQMLMVVKEACLRGSQEDSEVYFRWSAAKNRKLEYFLLGKVSYAPELQEDYLQIKEAYCLRCPSARRKFYRAVRDIASQARVQRRVKKMRIAIDKDDALSQRYFSRRGYLDYVSLVGRTSDGLKALKLSGRKSMQKFRIRRIRRTDLDSATQMEIQAHRRDTSSRMHKVLKKKSSEKLVSDLYRHLLKEKSAFVAEANGEVAGAIGFFIDHESSMGIVATVAVAPEYKGCGIAKALYRAALSEFHEKGARRYIGQSTTEAVLGLAKRMKRQEAGRTYTVLIKVLDES